jgi:hypothetical protein
MGFYWPFTILKDINQRLQRIETQLSVVHGRIIAMAGELDAMEAMVRHNSDVTDSAMTLLVELKMKLDEAIASGDMARVAALTAELGAKTQALADAIVANTPAAP